MMKKTWQIKQADYTGIEQLLNNRGINQAADIEAFLNPRLSFLKDPMEIPNIESAVKRVLLAKERNEKVLVYGDYDVDGVTGTAILLHVLKYLGLQADYHIPHRHEEGYGLSLPAVKEIAEAGVKLIITVDCGIANVAEVKLANELGLTVIITDHHTIPDKLPEAYAIVNPKMITGPHPSKNLAGAGVAFKFAWALLRMAGGKDNQFLTSLLDLAALGTFADVVPLVGENRIIAANGLKALNDRKRLGVRHLIEVAALSDNLSVRDVTFGLAPRINAAGRLEHASKSVELFITDDAENARSIATELQKINLKRRAIGTSIQDSVFNRITDEHVANNKVVVMSGEDWHPGVVGIVASKVVDTYSRPAVLVAVNDGVGRGSARSVSGINIYELLASCSDLFVEFGGHAGAAGFEIKPENINNFITRLQDHANKTVSNESLKPVIEIDAELAPNKISLNLVKELSRLEPFGEGNPEPIFVSRKLNLVEQRRVGGTGKHLKAKFADGPVTLEAIGFGLGDMSDNLNYNDKYDVVYNLQANEWNGFETVQLCLIDIRKATC
ncbi:MAG: single-stranded-DNA-specific exonuclease RecJ [bacterium]